MKCPVCGEHSPPASRPFQVPVHGGVTHAIRSGASDGSEIAVEWMRCANEACKEAVVRIHETTTRFVAHVPLQDTDTWIARLDKQIDGFLAEPGHPPRVTKHLHHFREAGNFGAHTQAAARPATTSGPRSLTSTMTRPSGRWISSTGYSDFIVHPARDKAFRNGLDEKIERAGRRPLEESDEDESAAS
jgi:Domain of unknown function (DUF4145)